MRSPPPQPADQQIFTGHLHRLDSSLSHCAMQNVYALPEMVLFIQAVAFFRQANICSVPENDTGLASHLDADFIRFRPAGCDG